MARFHNDDLAKLILRITCAGLLILHGSNSAINGIQHIKDMVRAAGLPEFIAYGNLVGEVVAPIIYDHWLQGQDRSFDHGF